MLFGRTAIVAIVAVFTVIAMTSVASACCIPVVYGVSNSPSPIPLSPAPIYVPYVPGSWSFGPCGVCGIGPSPRYVVDQGPDHIGPGLMVPFLTYRQPTIIYPYLSSGCCGGVQPPPPIAAAAPLITKAPPLAAK